MIALEKRALEHNVSDLGAWCGERFLDRLEKIETALVASAPSTAALPAPSDAPSDPETRSGSPSDSS